MSRFRWFAMSALAIGITAVALTAAALHGGGPALTSGTVTGRSYDDPDEWVQMICAVNGKYGCTAWMPVTHNDGPHWFLTLEGTVDGDIVTDDVEVTQHIFETCSDGWSYPECAPR